MEEYICDVCGTAFSETDSVCPVCGCAKTAASHAAGETVEESGYVKGGRFSKSNVRKRTRSTAVSNTAPIVTDIPEVDDEDDEEEIPQSNTGLIIIVILLLLAIIAVSTYIAIAFFGKDNGSKPNNTTSSSSSSVTTELKVPCTSIDVEEDYIVLTKDNTTAKIVYSLFPVETTDKIAFVSANPDIATVDANGNITAIANGTAKITLTCGDEMKQIEVVCALDDEPEQPDDPSILDDPKFGSFTIPEGVTVITQKEVRVTRDNVNVRKGPGTDYGKVSKQAMKNDTLIIYATYENGGHIWGLTDMGWIATEYTRDPSEPTPTLQLNRSDFTLTKSDVKWNLYDGSLDPKQIVWTSGNTAVATVKDGVVTAVGNGSTTITAEFNGEKATCKVYVNGF